MSVWKLLRPQKRTVCEGPSCLLVTNSPIYIKAYPPYWLIIIFPNYPSPTGLNPWSSPWVPDLAQWNLNYPWKAVSPTQMQPMVLEYLPIFTPKIAQLCRQIFHTWSIRARYKLVLLQLLTDAKRREFSGMIHFITINFIIPATPSNPSSNPA